MPPPHWRVTSGPQPLPSRSQTATRRGARVGAGMMMADATGVEIFTARRVIALAPATSSGQAAEPAAFVVLGERIVAAGSAGELHARFPEAALTDLGDGVIVPGFN